MNIQSDLLLWSNRRLMDALCFTVRPIVSLIVCIKVGYTPNGRSTRKD